MLWADGRLSRVKVSGVIEGKIKRMDKRFPLNKPVCVRKSTERGIWSETTENERIYYNYIILFILCKGPSGEPVRLLHGGRIGMMGRRE